jgi:acyl carrier protein
MNDLLSEAETKAVLGILARELNVSLSQITIDSRIEEDLGADSPDIVEITMAIEERFDLSIPDDQAVSVKTVGDLFELLADLLHPHGSQR